MKVSTELKGAEETLRKTAAFVEAERRAVKEAMEYILREMINYCKEAGPQNFRDRTSNLRNSYSININDMKEYPADTDPATLRAKVSQLENAVIKVEGNDYTGAISAGMEYAIWVELKSGYWVLQGSIDKFEPLIEKYFAKYMSVEKLNLL